MVHLTVQSFECMAMLVALYRISETLGLRFLAFADLHWKDRQFKAESDTWRRESCKSYSEPFTLGTYLDKSYTYASAQD